MSTTAFLDKLDYRQLKFCRDECDRRIKAIQEEEKKVAWAITDGGINLGWFRTENYVKAAERLASLASELWEEEPDKEHPSTHLGLNLAIEGHHLPLSEYNALFADGEWG
ncbi:TPA: hypothetical protein KAD01_004536 [Escherichia coli]|uniref:hypothetical protein n=1 Tax=Escherichia coli TaxID=562 RepID=UPI00107738CE|nr:hypothetical protein [Escherichia coli]EAC2054279.1 hypothetical protein [Escherichia coli]EFI3745619.1 hypothetical protein [Escherichia coli]MDW6637627.1 hypothetical protein [Escherichia coli]HAJ6946670.1 hypothetical protein [Escherichia coli]HAJ7032583.1 hypothetical protein [Escherichia coli]